VNKFLKVIAAVLAVALAGPLAADELADASRALCDNVKSCALEQMASQELTPEMRQMMEPMLANMCTQMNSKIKEVPTDHGLYKPALACIRSMQSLTCEQMQNGMETQTPECQEYEKLAREAGVTE
jgi:hypothetical protein